MERTVCLIVIAVLALMQGMLRYLPWHLLSWRLAAVNDLGQCRAVTAPYLDDI